MEATQQASDSWEQTFGSLPCSPYTAAPSRALHKSLHSKSASSRLTGSWRLTSPPPCLYQSPPCTGSTSYIL